MILHNTTFLVTEVTEFISQICFNMDANEDIMLKQNKPGMEGQITVWFLSCEASKIIETESRKVIIKGGGKARGGGGGEAGVVSA